jgi:hypothetical protein
MLEGMGLFSGVYLTTLLLGMTAMAGIDLAYKTVHPNSPGFLGESWDGNDKPSAE